MKTGEVLAGDLNGCRKTIPGTKDSSCPLQLRGAPDTALILCRSFTPKRNRQLRVKDKSKVPKWRLVRDSNLRPFQRKVPNLPMRYRVPLLFVTFTLQAYTYYYYY